jgi:hypothetical protein
MVDAKKGNKTHSSSSGVAYDQSSPSPTSPSKIRIASDKVRQGFSDFFSLPYENKNRACEPSSQENTPVSKLKPHITVPRENNHLNLVSNQPKVFSSFGWRRK